MRPYLSDYLEPAYVHDPDERADLLARAQELSSIVLTPFAASCLVMMASGYFSPLRRFMSKDEAMRVAAEMRSEEGMWPVPLLCCSGEPWARFGGLREIALRDPNQPDHPVMGVLQLNRVESVSEDEMVLMARHVFGTNDKEHPGVAAFMSQPRTVLSGSVKALSFSYFPDFGSFFRTASQVRYGIRQRGWKTAIAFQTRNPMHRAHEELCRLAKEETGADGLVIHMALGKLKEGDIPARTRISAIQAMVSKRMPPMSTMIAGYGFDMLYAGPREAVLHAIMRQNMGCSHFIVGRDHAGVGKHYGPFDAHRLLDQVSGWLGIEIWKGDHMCWSRKLGGIVRMGDHPDHGPEDWLFLSGTKVRQMLEAGEDLPEEFSRPEVAAVLKEHYARRRSR